ncbi:MAG: hypothetical protein WC845_01090 [Candidatus Staskawiczbacteria bacterium]|jgi:hypothetical protein
MTPTSKEQFLVEHNKLSPLKLQATLALLTKFQAEKRPLLKEDGWVVDKLRIPFISWMLALPTVEEKKEKKARGKRLFENYPRTKS